MIMSYELFTIVNTKINEEVTRYSHNGIPLSIVIQQVENENTFDERVTFALCTNSIYPEYANFSKALANSAHMFHKWAEECCDDLIKFYSGLGTLSPLYRIIKVHTQREIIEVLTSADITEKGNIIFRVKEEVKLK